VRDRLWLTAFWHLLVYPEMSSVGMEDTRDLLDVIIRRVFGEVLPDYVAAARVHYADGRAIDTAAQAVALRQLRRDLARPQRRLVCWAHDNTLYFCGHIAPPTGEDQDIECRLRRLACCLQVEHGIYFTLGLCYRSPLQNVDRQKALVELRRIAQYAVATLRVQMHQQKGEIRVMGEERRDDSGLISPQLARRIWEVTGTGDTDTVPALCAEISRCLFCDTYVPLLKLRTQLQSLVLTLSLAAQAAGASIEHLQHVNKAYLERLFSPYDYIRLEQIIHAAVAEFTAMVRAARMRAGEHPGVLRAEAFIRAHCTEPISLATVARAVGLSAPYLSQLFRLHRSTTVTEYINRERVAIARELLRKPGMSIGAVAFAAGFGSLQHFNRVFRALEGCTPSHYRFLKSVVS
jgi:AraC-like DNA-binding protein